MLVWSPSAIRDLEHVRNFVGRQDPAAAVKLVNTIFDFIERQLTDFPRSGHPGRVEGTFELVIPNLPYVVPYRLNDGRIEILRVYHANRLWPDRF